MYFLNNLNIQIRRTPLLIVLLINSVQLIQYNVLIAQNQLPQCFPADSSWDSIEFLPQPSADETQTTIDSASTDKDSKKMNITFHKKAMYIPRFYGFSYLKPDTDNIPEITSQQLLEKHFMNVKLTELDEDDLSGKESDRYYDFSPKSKGTWVIYLLASLNQIPFLEQKGLRIHPVIERERGGTVFGGSSLSLTDTLDYKACVISH